jgi:hypothetical protein
VRLPQNFGRSRRTWVYNGSHPAGTMKVLAERATDVFDLAKAESSDHDARILSARLE